MINEPTKIVFKGLAQIERTAYVRTLGHREYFETIHTVTQIAAGSVRTVGKSVGSNIFTVLQAMEFGDFEQIANKLLSGMMLDGVGSVDDPFECDYFRTNVDELYAATFAAAKALNPELFGKLNLAMGKKATSPVSEEEKDVKSETPNQ